MERCAAGSPVLQVGQSWAGAAEGAEAVRTPMAHLCTAQWTRGQRDSAVHGAAQPPAPPSTGPSAVQRKG